MVGCASVWVSFGGAHESIFICICIHILSHEYSCPNQKRRCVNLSNGAGDKCGVARLARESSARFSAHAGSSVYYGSWAACSLLALLRSPPLGGGWGSGVGGGPESATTPKPASRRLRKRLLPCSERPKTFPDNLACHYDQKIRRDMACNTSKSLPRRPQNASPTHQRLISNGS